MIINIGRWPATEEELQQPPISQDSDFSFLVEVATLLDTRISKTTQPKALGRGNNSLAGILSKM